MSNFTRRITFEPAYDRRDPNPSKNYGIHGVNLRMVLKGDEGAVSFLVHTNWYLPHVQKEMESNGRPSWMFQPMPADLGYHSPKPMYDGQTPISQTCEHIGNVPCYYDGSGLNAEPVFVRLLEQGEDGVWAALEDYYAATFDGVEATS